MSLYLGLCSYFWSQEADSFGILTDSTKKSISKHAETSRLKIWDESKIDRHDDSNALTNDNALSVLGQKNILSYLYKGRQKYLQEHIQ